jgi:uncharacterized membrane protein (UPF0127 family)
MRPACGCHPGIRWSWISRPFAAVLLFSSFLVWLPPAGVEGAATHEEESAPKAVAPDGHEFALEIASTPEQRAKGYMFRSRVPSGEGMLFIFPRSDFHSFWMKNCLVSLDILWLSEDLTIVHLESDLSPCKADPCPSYPAMSKARYVLEIAAGMAKKTGLRVGEKLRLRGIDLGKIPIDS